MTVLDSIATGPTTASRAPSGLARGTGLAILGLGAALHLLFVISLRTHWCDPLFLETGGIYGQASDYFGIYQAGDNLTEGRSIYDQEGRPEGSPRHVPYFYHYRYLPPTAYVAALGAWLLTPWPAYWVWVLTTELLLVALVVSLLRLRSPPEGARLALAGIALGFFPFYLEQWMGQFSFLMAAFLWGVFRPACGASPPSGADALRPVPPAQERATAALLRRPDLWSWGAAIALKNYPALFALPLLRLGAWRRVALAASLVIAVCLPYYLIHPDDVRRFLILNFRPMPSTVLGGSYGLASMIRALGWHLPPSIAGRLLVIGPADVYAGNIPMLAVNTAIILLSLWATWRMDRRRAPEVMALWALTFFLIYKDVWEYHYVMLLPVAWLLAARGEWRLPLLFAAWLALPTPYVFYRGEVAGEIVDRWPWWIVLLHYGSKAVPALGLYVLAWRRSRPPA